MHEVICPHCGQKFETKNLQPGTYDCATCKNQFEIPGTVETPGPAAQSPFYPSLNTVTVSHEGLNRTGYFFFHVLIILFWLLAEHTLAAKGREGLAREALVALELLILMIVLLGTVSIYWGRFKNIGVPMIWFLIIFVPFVNIIVAVLLLAYPPGYGSTKKMDRSGVTVLVAIVLLISGGFYILQR